MAVTSTRTIVNLKEGRYDHENERISKYTLGDELPAQLAELKLRPRTMDKPGYTLKRLDMKDKDKIISFLDRFFFRDEPMNKEVKLLENNDSRCTELEEYAASSLDEGVSVGAVDDDGELVAVIINGLARREEADYSDKSDECPNPKFRRILKVLYHLNTQARIWDHLPKSCHTVMETRIASTDTAWRGRGLMRILCEESERIAKEHGATAMRVDTTSAFSAAAAERLHYKKLLRIPYADLPYAPQPPAPHKDLCVYVKEL